MYVLEVCKLYQILNLSDTELTRNGTYQIDTILIQILNLSDTELIRC
jgi:hypothetical protein